MKKEISLVTAKCIYHYVHGVAWVAYAVLTLFNNLICNILAAALLFICIILSSFGLLSSNEPDDEMSRYNMMKAKARAMDFLKIVICIALIIIALLGVLDDFIPFLSANIHISLSFAVALALGVPDIIIGYLFAKYEKAGE